MISKTKHIAESVDSANDKGITAVPSKEEIGRILHIRGYAADFVEMIIAGGLAGITSRELDALDKDSRREMNMAICLLISLRLVNFVEICYGEYDQFVLSPTAVAALFGRKEYSAHILRPQIVDGFRIKDRVILTLSMDRFWDYPNERMYYPIEAISDSFENALEIVKLGLMDDYQEYLEPEYIQICLIPGHVDLSKVMDKKELAHYLNCS